jgi:hypothetical protein
MDKMTPEGVCVNIKDPLPLYIMDFEGGGVKCDFGTSQSCDIPSQLDFPSIHVGQPKP